jgi:hypothetical protein
MRSPTPGRRFFRLAGIVLAVESDPIAPPLRLHHKFEAFETDDTEPDAVIIRHHARGFPELLGSARLAYARPPYKIFDRGDAWIYRIGGREDGAVQTAVFSKDYRSADIYTPGPVAVPEVGFDSLTLLPTDQVLLAPLLAFRGGCLLHAGGVIRGGQGLAFAGHSTAGKSTMMHLLGTGTEILCDDRVALRPDGEGFRLHGTWSHGDVPEVSPGSAPLAAVFFLRKAGRNEAEPIPDRRDVVRRLLDLVIKPLETPEWWDRTLAVVERLAAGVPAYELCFDLSGGVLATLDALAGLRPGIDIPDGSR